VRIGYARVSTEDQSLDLQLDALRAAGCKRIYREKIGGSAKRRDELEQAIKALKPGDTLTVWRLDRLGRSLADLIGLMSRIHEGGCEFQSLTEAIDTGTAGGKLIFHIMGALAEFERRLIAERTKAGLAAAKARGVRLGQPPKLSREQMASADALLASGGRAEDIAGSFGVGRSTLYRSLRIRARQE
jgi:DNA invertase Pin-like site-specific DNA recombinase